MALQFSRESYLVLPISTLNEARPLQAQKALPLMEVTLLGIVTEVRPLQPKKALFLIDVTLLGIVTEVRFQQL
jgi:hypothetical protein